MKLDFAMEPNDDERQQHLQNRRKSKDRLSGSLYKDGIVGQFLSNKNNLSLTVNTDGAKKHKSAHQSAWPIFVTVDQIPSECQTPILVGLWYGRSAPNMHTFFKPVTEELNSLYENGITWSHGANKNITTKFVTSCFTSDIPARAKVLNFIGHMGHFSCLFCTNPGELVDVGKGNKTCKQIRYPEREKTFELRSSEQYFQDIELAVLHGETVRGIKGSNPLIEIHLFRIPYNIAIDLLHNVCNGEVKAFVNAVTSNVGEPFYIGAPQTIKLVSERLSSIKPVSSIPRLARPLEDRHFFSAKEWLHFLLFFGPISLQGILPEIYLEMLCEFSQAIYLLISDDMKSSDIDEAEETILKYVINCSNNFGPRYCVSNNHLLLHLADDARKFGSLLNHSTFEFESANGWLLKFIKSSKGVIQQAIKNYLLNVNLNFFLRTNQITISPKVTLYAQSLSTGRRRQNAHCSRNVTVLGKGVLYKVPLSIEELVPLQYKGKENYLVFERMNVKG
ncbi:hypothetical protein B566_EDAN015445 [Ephemera danica]|nr:hypothetical protein B566_EDAN015445 [Ephemera danica]